MPLPVRGMSPAAMRACEQLVVQGADHVGRALALVLEVADLRTQVQDLRS